MNIFAKILLLFTVLVAFPTPKRCIVTQVEDLKVHLSDDFKTTDNQDDKYHLHINNGITNREHEAVVEDNNYSFKTGTARPQRLQPTWNFTPLQFLGKSSIYYIHHSYPLRGTNDRQDILVTAIPRNASADYYVFALRRLIC